MGQTFKLKWDKKNLYFYQNIKLKDGRYRKIYCGRATKKYDIPAYREALQSWHVYIANNPNLQLPHTTGHNTPIDTSPITYVQGKSGKKYPPNTIEGLKQRYLDYLYETNSKSDGSIKGANFALKHFIKFLSSRMKDDINGVHPVKLLTGKKVYWYSKHLNNKDSSELAHSTRRVYLSHVKQFTKWVYHFFTDLPLNNLRGLELAKLNRPRNHKIIEIFTISELQTLYNYANNEMRLIMLLGLNAGLLGTDLSSLQWKHIKWRNNMPFRLIKTRSKTGVLTPGWLLWHETARLLKDHSLGRWKDETDGEGFIFLTKRGTPLVQRTVKLAGKRVVSVKSLDNVGKRFDLHKLAVAKKTGNDRIRLSWKYLRKTGVSWISKLGIRDEIANIELVEQMMLAHSPTSMARQHYTQVSVEVLDQLLQKVEDEFISQIITP